MATAAIWASAAAGGRPARSPSPMRRPQIVAGRPSKGRTRPSNCRARSCSIHLSNRSRRSCSLILPSAPNEFSDGLSGKEKVGRDLGFDPVEHHLLGSWADGLADDIGIEKKGHQPKSAERPVDLLRSIGSSASVRGEARRKATNSAPVFALGAVSIGCRDWRMSSASSPSERRAPAIALTRGASREGTVTSTR